jgi:type III secretory pathway component EscT
MARPTLTITEAVVIIRVMAMAFVEPLIGVARLGGVQRGAVVIIARMLIIIAQPVGAGGIGEARSIEAARLDGVEVGLA